MGHISNKDGHHADLLWGGDGTGLGHNYKPRVKQARILPTETQEQCALMQWWSLYAPTVDIDARLLFAIPNGAYLGRDQRGREIQMAVLKRMGLRPGVSDLMLAVARKTFHGLYVEMKAQDGETRQDQISFRQLVIGQGYKAEFCYGAVSAIETIKGYLG